jgi:hemoglobin
MKNTLITLGLLCSSLLALPALAKGTAPTTTTNTTTTAAAPAGLYLALGETAGITRLMDDFVNRLLIDPRIGGHFKDAKPQPLKDSLTRQICQLSGGPCQYTGPDMKTAHGEMDITKANFHALVEVLQAAMDAQGIAFSQQNRLLALLAPMQRDVITVR